MFTLKINGQSHDVDVPGDMPLLWVIQTSGTDGHEVRLRCGLCGCCTVHLDARPSDGASSP